MKQKISSLLIIMSLLAAPLTVSAAGQNTLAVDKLKGRAAEAQARNREVVVKLRPGTRIVVGGKASPFEFTKAISLSGRVKEIRENDFTFSSTSDHTGEVLAVISYADVLSIKHPSSFVKVLKKVGEYSLLGPAFVAFMPLYAIMALLGDLPSC